ncbi:Peroxisomal acyl-coenzyme A oxidase 1 [Bagarius yarrelli]|uniref:Peroxisomal acyl-coenzyme A oxidase 1 n=1 Tax=Bagarius yarrelli TaxID=175774 RepID=A0A556TTC9_BAGYA|nr:Peroxisomal acyl-coenzyme A oxidase 1 [Bagarius yarrelli]
MNPDLRRERENATFETEILTNILDGSAEKTKRRREIESLVINDPDFQHEDLNFLSRSERYDAAVKKSVQMFSKIRDYGISDPEEIYSYKRVAKRAPHEAFGLHYVMFMPTLSNLCTPEQRDKWLPLASSFKVVGTYAQTELGHARFMVADLALDPRGPKCVHNGRSEPLDLHLGMFLTTLLNQASPNQLDTFFTPAWNLEIIGTYAQTELGHGVVVGDIGPKFGFDEVDNGFLKLDNIRIPRENMLMKYSKVQPDGTYVKPPSDKLTYGTMVFIRAMIVGESAIALSKSCTIAIRYSAVRHQSELRAGEPEPQIMDYQAQQYKLFPLLATAYAFTFVGQYMKNTYNRITGDINQGDFSQLPEVRG